MSSPTSGFSKLSISRMPPTRPEAGKLQPGREDPDDSDGEDSNDEQGEDSSAEGDSVIRSSHTRLRYDTSRLTPTTTRRAKAGLKEPFTLGHCSLYNPSQSSEYFAFQIFETVNFSVRIGAPDSEYRELTCHCDTDPRPCRHIFWLLDQIAAHTLSATDKTAPLPLSPRGFTKGENSDAYHHIAAAGPGLFQELDCDLRTDTAYTEPPPAAATAERIKDVRDILASFSTATRDDFRADIFDELPAAAAADSTTSPLFPTDLEKTLAHAALANEDLFRHLRALVPSSHCAAAFFRKHRDRAAAALAQLDKYIATRPREAGAPAHDIPYAAKAIVAAVRAILERVHEARSPLSQAAREAAAESLALILLDVSQRNVDVYASPQWARTRQQALPLGERNLFARLFGTAPARDRERFLLDGLADLGDAAKGVVQVLEEALEAFGENRAPIVYLDRLAWLVGSLKGGGEGVGGSGGSGAEGSAGARGKRGAGEGEVRGRKRMK